MNGLGVILGTLFAHFVLMSLLAFGGAGTVIPEMHRLAVETTGWMTDQEFTDLFALAQAAPGPNVMIVTLIGWQVAGLAGALTATLAMFLPACTLAFVVAGVWERFKDRLWRAAIQRGIMPATVGLVAASPVVIAGASGGGAMTWLILGATALLAYGTRLNPLWPLGAAAVLGMLGLV